MGSSKLFITCMFSNQELFISCIRYFYSRFIIHLLNHDIYIYNDELIYITYIYMRLHFKKLCNVWNDMESFECVICMECVWNVGTL